MPWVDWQHIGCLIGSAKQILHWWAAARCCICPSPMDFWAWIQQACKGTCDVENWGANRCWRLCKNTTAVYLSGHYIIEGAFACNHVQFSMHILPTSLVFVSERKPSSVSGWKLSLRLFWPGKSLLTHCTSNITEKTALDTFWFTFCSLNHVIIR